MQVTLNTQRYNQNYNNLQNNSQLQCCKPKPQTFTGGQEGLVSALTSKSKFFEPLEKIWNKSVDWLAENFVAKSMNTEFVAKFAEKFKDSKIITNHMTTIGAATGTGMYMYRTMTLPEDKMDSDRKKILTLNHALTFGASTAGAYLLDGALVGKWKKVTNKYAELYTKDKNLLSKIDDINKGLVKEGKNKIDLIDYAYDYLGDKKFANRLIGMDIAKKLLIFAMIYRYVVPVAVTPIANKLGDKFLAHKKEQEEKFEKS